MNGTQVPQGEKAFHYTDFQVEPVGDILNIHITEEEASDYSGQTLKHERLYRIDKDKEYEAIQLFKNGQEVSFDGISG
ncbi:hypothetical protein [Cytobacillus purgationiresistens]|uniref:Uncharacterized protein n=1 Tax=Cytobacillus purgationiresistens TaxID=863449 RepID=A0ABU0AK53_9BACI|nr:hypothetical protein [Cytobacillus purgationiresistens]MDQ0271643.1 hypothetical protein [Cytobacillus purgationiresistens]